MFRGRIKRLRTRRGAIARRNSGFAPSLWRLEVANVLTVAERRGRITATDADRFLEMLARLGILIDEGNTSTWKATLSLARLTGLSAHDAAYLELAIRGGLPLATLDERFAMLLQRIA